MTHATRVTEAERAVLSAAKAWYREHEVDLNIDRETDLLATLRILFALEAATCPKCGGAGTTYPLLTEGFGYAMVCPAACDAGRKREGT